jgi:pimeloyl-ACP methyl ester carboxylesterase
MPTVDLPQGTLDYVDVGEGPTLLFVHGVLVDRQIWLPAIELLKARFRCIAPTWPIGSHRIAMKPDADLTMRGQARLVQDFAAALGLEDVTLVGNDTGGAVCQLVVAENPPRIRKLVLTDCDAFEVFPPAGFGHLMWAPKIPGVPALTFALLRNFRGLLRWRWAYGALTYKALDDALLWSWIEPSATDPAIRRDLLKLLDGAGPAVTLDVAERLGAFDGPALLVWSRDDWFFPFSLAERLAEKLRRAEIRVVEKAGLLLPLDAPEALAATIVVFHGTDRA